MTVIRPNSITGVTSITAQGDNISFYSSDGVSISQFNANINATSGVSTVANLNVTGVSTLANLNVTGVVTATSFSGDGTNLSNTGSTLSAASGTQRVVLTTLTTGTMTSSSTDADLTFNASSNTLSIPNISASGVITATSFSGDGTNLSNTGSTLSAASGTQRVVLTTLTTGTMTSSSTDADLTFNASSNTLSIPNISASGVITATSFSGDGSGLTGAGSTVVNDTTTNSTFYPLFTSITSGTVTGSRVSTTKLSFNPSTGTLSATTLSGTVSGANVSGNISGNAANITAYTVNQSVGTSNNVQFNSIGAGTAASGTAGEIRATNNVTAYYSDDRLKTKLGNIENAIDKVCSLNGFYYEANKTAQDLGYKVKREVGVSAQEVERILPEIVAAAPIDEKYKTIYYERLVPLLIEAIKEQQVNINKLNERIDYLERKCH